MGLFTGSVKKRQQKVYEAPQKDEEESDEEPEEETEEESDTEEEDDNESENEDEDEGEEMGETYKVSIWCGESEPIEIEELSKSEAGKIREGLKNCTTRFYSYEGDVELGNMVAVDKITSVQIEEE